MPVIDYELLAHSVFIGALLGVLAGFCWPVCDLWLDRSYYPVSDNWLSPEEFWDEVKTKMPWFVGIGIFVGACIAFALPLIQVVGRP